MGQTENKALRPFHETVVDAINRASNSELECLATIIKGTKIPKNHDKIIKAWNARREDMAWGDEDLGVPASLLSQKEVRQEE